MGRILSERSCWIQKEQWALQGKNLKKINWRIIALQSCVGFCLMTIWISPKCVCAYPLHPGPLSHTLYLTPLGHHRALSWVPCMKVKSEREVAQSCPTLSDPMDCSPPGFSVHGIFQARVLEWGAIAFSDSSFLLVTYFTHDSVYMSMLLSQFSSLSPLSVTTSLFYDRPHLCVYSCLTHRLKGKCWNLLREPFFMVILATYSCETAVRNLFCPRDLSHRRQFFLWTGGGDDLGMIQAHYIDCGLYFCY